jgi:hypothetical protein
MAGLESVMDGMEGENRMVQEQAKALHEDLHGEGWESGEGEPMRVMAARDVHIHEPPPKPAPPPIEVIRDDKTSVEKKPMGNLAKAAIASGLGAALLGGGWLAGKASAPAVGEPPAVAAPIPPIVNTTQRPDEIEVWRPGE